MRSSRLLAVFAAAMVFALPAAASGGGSETWLGLPRIVWLSANLAAFLGVLVYFAGPPIKAFLAARAGELEQSMRLARRQEQEAEEMGTRLETQIAELRQEVEELRARAERDGQADREAILAQTARERERMEQQTKAEIAYRLEQARRDLTRHTAALASELAKEQLTRDLTPADRRRVFDRNLGQLAEREA